MTNISRQKIVAEELIRTHVRKRIKKQLLEQQIAEEKIRKIVRVLLEAETGDEEPSTYTGINVLANVLEKIIPKKSKIEKIMRTES